jgi:hypothetical protein
MKATKLPAQTEKSFQAQVEQLAKLYGWKIYHTRYSFRSAAGFPDLVLVRPPRLIFAELKRNTGTVTPEQWNWILTLKEVPGVEVCIWRPENWKDVDGCLEPK